MNNLNVASKHLATLCLRDLDAEVGVVAKEGRVSCDGQRAGDRQWLARGDLEAAVGQRVTRGGRVGCSRSARRRLAR